MKITPGVAEIRSVTDWRDVLWPREHGSWSLALEPLALGLLVAPSVGGAWVALAAVAGFFARRPLKIAALDARPERRAAARALLAVLVIAAGGFFLAACTRSGGTEWLRWLLPVTVAGTVFLFFDLRGDGREEIAEVAGAAAFAFVPATLAALAGWSALPALALALVICGRSVPTVLTVRAYLRAEKSGERRVAPALIASALAIAIGIACVHAGFAPWSAVGMLALLAVRAGCMLVWPRPTLRARTLGTAEAMLGLAFIVACAASWHAEAGSP